MKTATRLKFSFSALALLALALPGLAQTNVPLQNIPVAATAGTADRFLMSAQSGTNWNARTITLSNLTTAIQALEDARNAFYVHADTNSAGLSAIMGTNGNLSYQPAALGASVGLGALIHFSAAVSQTNRPVRIMAFGDSLSDTTTGGLLSGVLAGVTNYLPLVGYDQSYYPLMWVQYGMTNSPGGGWYTTQPDTYWWFQHFFLPAGGQIGWGAGAVDGSGLPGTGIPSDDLSVKYVQEPGAGTFAIITSTNNGSTWKTNRTVNANGTLTGVVTNLSELKGTVLPYRLKVLGLTGGSLGRTVVIEATIRKSTGPGVVAEWWAAPGHGLYDWLAVPTNITWPIFQAAAPDLVLCKEIHGTIEMNAPTNMPALDLMFQNCLTNGDVIYLGHCPLPASNPNASDSPRRNGKTREFAIATGRAYWDGYAASPPYNTLTASGLATGDGTHMSLAGGIYFGQMLWHDLERVWGGPLSAPIPAPALPSNLVTSNDARALSLTNAGNQFGGSLTGNVTGTFTGQVNPTNANPYNVKTNEDRGITMTNQNNSLGGTFIFPLQVNPTNGSQNAPTVIGSPGLNEPGIWFSRIGDNPAGYSNATLYADYNSGSGFADDTIIMCPAGGNKYGTWFKMGGNVNTTARFWYPGGLELCTGSSSVNPGPGGLAAAGVIQTTGSGYFSGNGSNLTRIPIPKGNGMPSSTAVNTEIYVAYGDGDNTSGSDATYHVALTTNAISQLVLYNYLAFTGTLTISLRTNAMSGASLGTAGDDGGALLTITNGAATTIYSNSFPPVVIYPGTLRCWHIHSSQSLSFRGHWTWIEQ